MKSSITHFLGIAWLVLCAPLSAATYYIDSEGGADNRSGTASDAAWRSLDKLRQVALEPGDRILLKRGSKFSGSILIESSGREGSPIAVDAYGDGPLPLIDANGHAAGVEIVGARHIEVRNLAITGSGKSQGSKKHLQRHGVLVRSVSGAGAGHIAIRDLHLFDLYGDGGSEHEGRLGKTHLGYGVTVRGSPGNLAEHIRIEGCRIERTAFKAIEVWHAREVVVETNYMEDIGGPAIQPGNVTDMVVRGNTVMRSGAFLDPRMHGRGSGIWPWSSERILIERNAFIGARGKADSCGIHIDFNCRDVIVQYNLSIDNEGGFIEILGNNFNCAYRYNISISDGARVKGQKAAHQEGKVLWTSGYVGRQREKVGPTNSYIYNNTIYVGPGTRSCFSVTGTTDGLLVANNIFHILGETVNVLGDQDQRKERTAVELPRAIVSNNLVVRADLFPAELPFKAIEQLVGDAGFQHAGGLSPSDYIPSNAELIRERGIPIAKLPGDERGLMGGLAVETDFFGNPVGAVPDIGAIQMSRK